MSFLNMSFDDSCDDFGDDEYDTCVNCGSDDFEANERDWERVCMSCGMTSPFELFNFVKRTAPYHYRHENYFINGIIAKALAKGAPIPSDKQQHLAQMFSKSVEIFHTKKKMLKRRNYPSYQYALLRLCQYLGIDVSNYITLPKMKTTLQLVIEHWPEIDPVMN